MKKAVQLVAAGMLVMALASCRSNQTTNKHFDEDEAMGSAEEADGFMQYELMRLRDPATGQVPSHMREKELAFAATLPHSNMLSGQNKSTSATWQARGPWNVGGRTRAFAIDVANDNTLIAG